MEREFFKTRLGFLLVSAGCAVGIGNVWRFPFLVGQNGGGFFVLFYLLFLILMGAPVLTMELAVGRASHRTVRSAFKMLEPKGSFWHLHGVLCFFGCSLLMMYYTTVSGWMLNYFGKFSLGTFSEISSEQVNGIFDAMLQSPAEMILGLGIIVFFGFFVNSFGIQKGLEKISKWIMIGLFLLIVLLALNSLRLPNAMEGVKFYLLPNWDNLKEQGIGNVLTAAMNQAFFTLSIGIGSMEIFGSYMSDKFSIGGESIRICSLDTLVALIAGFIIMPACFAYGIQPDAGPSLIFLSLPQVFVHMSGGRFWGSVFFLFMTFASFSTVLAVFEYLISYCLDEFHWTRKKTTILCFFAVFLLSLPCALGYNILSDLYPIGNRDILESEDFILSNILLPFGALVFILFCVTKWGWGFDKYIAEANKGKGLKIPHWFKYYFRFVLPILIFIVFINGLL